MGLLGDRHDDPQPQGLLGRIYDAFANPPPYDVQRAKDIALQLGMMGGVTKPTVLAIGSGTPPVKGLVVAGIDDAGKLHYGQPGETHGDLLNVGHLFGGKSAPGGPRNIVENGFAGPDGRYLTREDALKSLPADDGARGTQFSKESGGLDAYDYNETKRSAAEFLRRYGLLGPAAAGGLLGAGDQQ